MCSFWPSPTSCQCSRTNPRHHRSAAQLPPLWPMFLTSLLPMLARLILKMLGRRLPRLPLQRPLLTPPMFLTRPLLTPGLSSMVCRSRLPQTNLRASLRSNPNPTLASLWYIWLAHMIKTVQKQAWHLLRWGKSEGLCWSLIFGGMTQRTTKRTRTNTTQAHLLMANGIPRKRHWTTGWTSKNRA